MSRVETKINFPVKEGGERGDLWKIKMSGWLDRFEREVAAKFDAENPIGSGKGAIVWLIDSENNEKGLLFREPVKFNGLDTGFRTYCLISLEEAVAQDQGLAGLKLGRRIAEIVTDKSGLTERPGYKSQPSSSDIIFILPEKRLNEATFFSVPGGGAVAPRTILKQG